MPRKYARRRRTYRRRTKSAGHIRGPKGRLHHYAVKTSPSAIVTRVFHEYNYENTDFSTPATAGNVGGIQNKQVALNQLNDYTKYTDVFRWYRIVRVEHTWWPTWGAGAGGVRPTILWAKNDGILMMPDPSGGTTTLDSLEEYGPRLKMWSVRGNQSHPFKVSYTPNTIANPIDGSTSVARAEYKKWFPTDVVNVAYNGLSAYSTSPDPSQTYEMMYHMKVVVEFKGYH